MCYMFMKEITFNKLSEAEKKHQTINSPGSQPSAQSGFILMNHKTNQKQW